MSVLFNRAQHDREFRRVRAVGHPFARLIVIFCFILITLRPWPSEDAFGAGVVRITEASVLFALAMMCILLMLNAGAKVPVRAGFWFVPVLLLVSVAASLLVNISDITASDSIELARPVYALSLIGIGYYGARTLGLAQLQRVLFTVILTVGILQIPLIPAQFFAPDAMKPFHLLYSDRKVVTDALRATGTFGNPNHLAIFLTMAQIATFCTIAGGGRWLLWGVLYVGIIFTGSLSLLVFSLVLILPLKVATERNDRLAKLAVYLFVGTVLLTVLLVLFTWVIPLEEIPRLARLQAALRAGLDGLLGLKNFQARWQYWLQLLAFVDLNDPVALIFGSGPMKGRGLDVADNEILFILLRHGVLGLTVALIILAGLLWTFFRSRSVFATFGLMVVVLFVLCTPFFEMFTLWRFMPYYLIPLGAMVWEGMRRTLAPPVSVTPANAELVRAD